MKCDNCIYATKQKVQPDREKEETACLHEKVNVYIFHDNPGCAFFTAKPEPEVKPA